MASAKECTYFKIERRYHYDGSCASFTQPVEIGTFSNDADNTFCPDGSQLRYYSPPEDIDLNLDTGYETYVQVDPNRKKYLDDLLQWIVLKLNKDKFRLADTTLSSVHDYCLNTDFICWRGLLTRLMCTPYDDRDGWIIGVTLHNGTLYMAEFETEKKRQYKLNMTDTEKHMTYWGHKFEQYVATDDPKGVPNTDEAVNQRKGFYSVVRSSLEQYSLVYGGEVDCLSSNEKNTQYYIELKTNKNIECSRQEYNFKRSKLIKWYAQSFLLNIPCIVCGFRDANGVVKELATYETLNIPKIVEEIGAPWKANVCINFLNEFLKFIKKTVVKDDPSIVYVMTYNPGEYIECKEMPKSSDFIFLPMWFTGTVGRPGTEEDILSKMNNS